MQSKLTLDTIELYDEPIVLFTDVLCNIAKSCMPRNMKCKDAMKA